MNNWYGIETEAAFRRREWERVVRAEARSAEAVSSSARFRFARLPQAVLARLQRLTALRLTVPSAMEPRCRTATCL